MKFSGIKLPFGLGKISFVRKARSNTLICVDIQVESEPYAKHINICGLSKLMSKYSNVIYIMDENMSGGEPSMPESLLYTFESEDGECSIPDNIDRVVKAYGGFFRSAIDMGVEEETIQFCKDLLVLDDESVMDVHEGLLEMFAQEWGRSDYSEMFEEMKSLIDEPIQGLSRSFFESLPDGVDICGGGENECLREVTMALDIFDKDYNILREFVY